ncbi:MAG TPA: BatD family protein, partial [Candidatus Saccharimonadales bacterium]|nr:BatD family protein [Candidatus Saccharimonadales bacterium]
IAAGPGESTSTSMVWTNGGARVTSTKKFTWQLLPKRTGTLGIPAISVKVGGRIYRTKPQKVEVVKGSVRPRGGGVGAPPPSDPFGSIFGRSREQPAVPEGDIFVDLSLDRTEAWVGQQVLMTYKIYTQVPLAALPQPQEMPKLSGFWAEDFDFDPRSTIRKKMIRGKEYTEITLMKKALFPTRSGELKIDETVFQVPVRAVTNDPFDRLLNPSRTVYRRAPARSLKVRALPEKGRPDSFQGAVGQFQMDVSADRTKASVNDAVGVTVAVSGDGNLRTVGAPVVADVPDYRRFDPKLSESRSAKGDRIEGTRKWSYVFVPLAPGDKPIPGIRFSYFDPETASYKELEGPRIDIDVARGQETASAPASAVRREVVAMRQDIRYIKPAGALRVGVRPFYGSGWLYVLILLPVAGNVALLARQRWREHLEGNVDLLRRRRATRVARTRLKKAGQLAGRTKEKDAEVFFDEVDRALTGYVADKFNVSPAGLTRERIAELLAERGVAEDLRGAIVSCLETCDMGRFAPGGTGRERLESLVARSRDA